MTQKQVRTSLLEQLRLQNKTSEFYEDLVNDYMTLLFGKLNTASSVTLK